MAPVLAGIRVHPVKSLAGLDLVQAEVEACGLRGDRRWLVLTPDGDVVTAREVPAMLRVNAAPLEDGGVVLGARDGSELRIHPPVDGEPMAVTVSRLDMVRGAGAEADAWLSRQLERPVRIGWLDDPGRRSVSERHGGLPGDRLNLADAGPVLLTSEASLRCLNRWIAEGAAERGEDPPAPITMRRFRPNLVIEHVDEPFAEDGWLGLRIGDVEFRLAEHCDRCFLTTFDPDTLERGKEPLRTLARHRRRHRKTWFGIRLIPVTSGTVRVGDAVTVLSASPRREAGAPART